MSGFKNYCVVVSIVLMGSHFVVASVSDETKALADLHAQIGRDIGEVKKHVPNSYARKIATVLDSVDKMYNMVKNSITKDSALVKESANKALENTVLQNELLAKAQENKILTDALHQSQLKIVSLSKDVEKQKTIADMHKKQNDQLVAQNRTQPQADLITEEIQKQLKPLDVGAGTGGTTASGVENKGALADKGVSAPVVKKDAVVVKAGNTLSDAQANGALKLKS